jgi:hypothetical protein
MIKINELEAESPSAYPYICLPIRGNEIFI